MCAERKSRQSLIELNRNPGEGEGHSRLCCHIKFWRTSLTLKKKILNFVALFNHVKSRFSPAVFSATFEAGSIYPSILMKHVKVGIAGKVACILNNYVRIEHYFLRSVQSFCWSSVYNAIALTNLHSNWIYKSSK